MKKKPSHPMLRKYTVTIEEQIVQEFPVEAYDLSHGNSRSCLQARGIGGTALSTDYPPDHGTAQQDRKNNRMERILTITTRER